jgi:hypothetical protein
MVFAEITSLVIVIVIVALLFYFLKSAVTLAINSVIGFFALFAVNIFLADPIPINFWTIIIIAIGGIFGFIIELVLHFLGIAF